MNTPWLLKFVAHDRVATQRWDGHGLDVCAWVRRDDAMHPVINGNKAYKLAFHLERAFPGSTVLSCGGVWSNQLHALAFAACARGIKTAAIVRGYPSQPTTATLTDCQHWGMSIHLVNHATFRQRYDELSVQTWLKKSGADYWIPEGADDALGWQGLAVWARQINMWLDEQPVDAVWIEAGTGAMAAAMIRELPDTTTLCVVPVVRDVQMIGRLRQRAMAYQSKLRILEGYDGGGFGRVSPELDRFVQSFNLQQAFKIEPVYSGKLMTAFIEQASSIGRSHLIIHSGGLQGLRSRLQDEPAPVA